MERKGRRARATCRGRELRVQRGLMRRGIYGCLEGMVTTPLGEWAYSAICGNMVEANGHGWVDRTLGTNRAFTGLKGRPLLATFPERDFRQAIGLMRREIFGCSAGWVTMRLGHLVALTTCGSTGIKFVVILACGRARVRIEQGLRSGMRVR